ncbi:Lrp/AsnC family transcriptional regulator [Luteimonas salinilitoris]|uniref:Lrp/AsnC family transcriptional regulator n=1 Tax=Luteimonas salinilitoris TaxID=3237697 RepID=A0ABV4HVS2_9GAMM
MAGRTVAVIFPDRTDKFTDRRLDDIDRRLLQLLVEDASRPLKTLAAAVSLSRSSVRDRIARMEADGVIRRYTVDVAPADAGLTTILLVRLARTPDPAVVRAVVSMPDVVRCYSLSGEIDLLVELAGTDVAELNLTRDRIARLAGVTDVVTSFVLNRDKVPAG